MIYLKQGVLLTCSFGPRAGKVITFGN
jgi:hypothetical protein